MELSLLITRFLNISNYDKDDDTLLILVYGSRIMGTNKESSDLDVLVVTSKNISYRRAMVIDGIPIDITYVSINELESDIYKALSSNSTYYNSIFKNGIVILDKMNTYEVIENMLNKKVRRRKWLDGRIIDGIKYYINEFINCGDDLHYFKTLDLLRRLHHVNNGCSYIRFTKVYDLYTDSHKAKDLYMLKLPDEEYRETYLKALSELDQKKRLEYLLYFYHEFDNVKFNDVEEEYYLNDDEIKKRLFEINNAKDKCIDMIKANHPYARCLYYMIIDDMYNLYELIYHNPLEIDNIDIDDENAFISNLETIFDILDESYKIDYSNVTINILRR